MGHARRAPPGLRREPALRRSCGVALAVTRIAGKALLVGFGLPGPRPDGSASTPQCSCCRRTHGAPRPARPVSWHAKLAVPSESHQVQSATTTVVHIGSLPHPIERPVTQTPSAAAPSALPPARSMLDRITNPLTNFPGAGAGFLRTRHGGCPTDLARGHRHPDRLTVPHLSSRGAGPRPLPDPAKATRGPG